MSNTGISSYGIRHLKRLKKLRCVDLSENAAIKGDVLPRLAPLAALEYLDLHHTEVTARGKLTAEHLRHLRRLKRLRCLDLSGTGASLWRIGWDSPNCRVIGSRASDVVRPGMKYAVDCSRIASEAEAIGMGCLEERDYSKHTERALQLLCHGLQDATSRRMIAISERRAADATFQQLRPIVEAYALRLNRLPYADERGRKQALRDLLVAARSNAAVQRLYLAATDLELADALRAHLQYLDKVRVAWAWTNVENTEHEHASRNLPACLRDAARQLGLEIGPASDAPPDEIIAIWEKTGRPLNRTPREALSCWEADMVP